MPGFVITIFTLCFVILGIQNYNLQQALSEINNRQATKVFTQHQNITENLTKVIKEMCSSPNK